jgi:hypothetical protein
LIFRLNLSHTGAAENYRMLRNLLSSSKRLPEPVLSGRWNVGGLAAALIRD